MRNNPPCFDPKTKEKCKDRCVGCSTICALWHDYEQRRNEEYEQRRERSLFVGAELGVAQKKKDRLIRYNMRKSRRR